MTNLDIAERAPAANSFEVLDYEAPFLIEKLVKDRIAETPEEAEALFAEVKRYMVLVSLDQARSWHMYSLRVDECWHQFILFTRQYIEFCRRYFGRYIQHAPSNASEAKTAPPLKATTFQQFSERYQELFGVPLPDLWHDWRHVTTGRRILNNHVGRLTLRGDDDDGMIDLLNPAGDIVLSVNEIAGEALAFISRTGAFYVRELPGDLDDEEKVALVSTLVRCKVLRLAS